VHQVQLLSGKQFQAEPGERLLDAAARQAIVLPYSCRTGRCSTCKCQVLSGRTEALVEETGLSDAERADGWVLACVRAALSDLSLDAPDLGDVALPAAKTTPCRIQALERLAPDVMQVRLRLPPSFTFEYLPGQSIDLIGHGGIRRAYSVASAPRADKCLDLHIRRVEGGQLSHYWFEQAQVSDLLRLHGPLGTFFLGDVAGQNLVCLATGTGMAPIKAMLEGLALRPAAEQPRSLCLYWGARLPQDLYWSPEHLAVPHQYLPVLSRADASWSGRRGWITEALVADLPDLPQTQVYACGSDAMIRHARRLLLARGLPDRQFHSDAFVASYATPSSGLLS
jgi:CDP-4-dehydro-6-deoxyglucose reductase, E3